MANEEQLSILRQGTEVWNKWRAKNFEASVDLSEADLSRVGLRGVDLRKANLNGTKFADAKLDHADFTGSELSGASLHRADLHVAKLKITDLSGADLTKSNLASANLKRAKLNDANLANSILVRATLRQATLKGANLIGARCLSSDFSYANLSKANLCNAKLTGASFEGAKLTEADLTNTILRRVNLVGTHVESAKISGSNVYGVNVWDLDGEFAEQKDLVVSSRPPLITVDNIKVAQFIYLILKNGEIRNVINTLTSKSVLILGRFAIPERKRILDELRNKLREYNLLPIVFDFDRPTDKDFTETIKTLAGLSYFVIADVTNPKSSPLELQATVPDYQIPFVPIIQEGESPFAMMVDLQKKYNWVLLTRSYDSVKTLMSALKPGIIDPAVEMRNKLRQIKAQEHPVESLKEYLDKTL